MRIGPEQIPQARVLFEGVRHVRPEGRAEWLLERCPSDAGLREAVLQMAAFDESGDDFLETPALALILTLPLFQRGDIVDRRYEIVGEARPGGMGEVYEATDSWTGARMALKTVRRSFVGLDETESRLRQEIKLNQKIAHPNVCKIYHLGIDRRPEGDVLYLTMDFLEGRTLWERLKDESPLPKKEALQIAEEVARGLDAAHEEGVIHSDLKPGNIMLVPRKGTTRAVILDFGIACTVDDHILADSVAGTLPYMPPEKFDTPGAAANPASDIYSFGVILYEMFTGRQPFDPASPAAERKKLPPAPSKVRRGIPRRWDRAILRCLDPAPEKRFRKAADAIEALQPARWPITAAVLLLIFAVYAAIKILSPSPATVVFLQPEVAAGAEKQSAVLEDAATYLQRVPLIRREWLIFPPSVARTMKINTPSEAKRVLGADYVLTSAIQRGESVTFDLKLVNTANRRVKAAVQKTCGETDPVCLQDGMWQAAGGLLVKRAFASVPQTRISAVALPYYLEGMYYLRRDSFSYQPAIANLQKAMAADPAAVQPRVALADAYMQRFTDTRNKAALIDARNVLDEVAKVQPNLPELQASLAIIDRNEGRYEEAAQRLELALRSDPQNYVFHWRLGAVYGFAGRDSEAVSEFQKTIALQPHYWGGYLDFANFHLNRGRFQEAAQLLEQLIRFAPDHAQALAALGAVDLVLRRPAEAARYSARSCELNPGRICFENWGLALYRQGDVPKAIEMYERALSFGHTSVHLYLMLADAYAQQQDGSRSQEYYRRLAARAQEELTTDLKKSDIRAYLAYAKSQLGDREGALFEMEQASKDAPQNKDVMKYGVLTYESLGLRDKALEALRNTTREVLLDLEPAWKVRQLRLDPRYAQVKQEVMNK